MAGNRRKRSGRRAGSFRTCCGCRKRLPRNQSLRVVRDVRDDGKNGARLVPDLYGKLPGRGAHLCPDLACFQRAAGPALSRAFRAQVRLEDPGRLAQAFLRASRDRIRSLMGSSLRSGWLVAGRTAVRESLSRGRLALLVLARDASRELAREMETRAGDAKLPCLEMFSVEELSAFHRGKPLAILGIAHRGIARRLAEEIEKASTLAKSIKRRTEESRSELTGKSDRGKMPQQRVRRAGSSRNRS